MCLKYQWPLQKLCICYKIGFGVIQVQEMRRMIWSWSMTAENRGWPGAGVCLLWGFGLELGGVGLCGVEGGWGCFTNDGSTQCGQYRWELWKASDQYQYHHDQREELEASNKEKDEKYVHHYSKGHDSLDDDGDKCDVWIADDTDVDADVDDGDDEVSDDASVF